MLSVALVAVLVVGVARVSGLWRPLP
jgi:hypothetical protein